MKLDIQYMQAWRGVFWIIPLSHSIRWQWKLECSLTKLSISSFLIRYGMINSGVPFYASNVSYWGYEMNINQTFLLFYYSI